MVGLHLAGVGAFIFPFLVRTSSGAEPRASDAGWLMALLAPALVAGLFYGSREMSGSKKVALIGVLAALTAMSRLPISFAGANLVFFLPIVAASALGGSMAFLIAACGMAVSGLVTGGLGPWLPFQMLALGWVGAAAGLLRPVGRLHSRNAKGLLMACVGAMAALFYGAIMDLYFWPVAFSGPADISYQPGMSIRETIGRFTAFYLVTSLPWDAVGAAFNAVLLFAIGPQASAMIVRSATRLGLVRAGREAPPSSRPIFELPGRPKQEIGT